MEEHPAGLRASTIEAERGDRWSRLVAKPRLELLKRSRVINPSDGMLRPLHAPTLPVVPTCVKEIPTCGNSARTDLCGGRAVMRVPTAIGQRHSAVLGQLDPPLAGCHGSRALSQHQPLDDHGGWRWLKRFARTVVQGRTAETGRRNRHDTTGLPLSTWYVEMEQSRAPPSVPMKVRHLAPGNLDLRALKDNHAHAHAGEAD